VIDEMRRRGVEIDCFALYILRFVSQSTTLLPLLVFTVLSPLILGYRKVLKDSLALGQRSSIIVQYSSTSKVEIWARNLQTDYQSIGYCSSYQFQESNISHSWLQRLAQQRDTYYLSVFHASW
jgi:hypothetical protein